MTAKVLNLHKTAIMTCAIDVSCLMSYSKHVDVQRYTRTSIMKRLMLSSFKTVELRAGQILIIVIFKIHKWKIEADCLSKSIRFEQKGLESLNWC